MTAVPVTVRQCILQRNLRQYTPLLSHTHNLYSTKKTTTKRKYNPNTLNKTPSKPSASSQSQSSSLSDFVDQSNKKSTSRGWNGTFYRCYHLLDYNPMGITGMMHTFNVTTAFTAIVSWGSIFALSQFQIYSFPASWLFAWCTLRVFSDIFPVFPKLHCWLIEKYAFEMFPLLRHLKFSRLLPDPELQTLSALMEDQANTKGVKKIKSDLLKQQQQEQEIGRDRNKKQKKRRGKDTEQDDVTTVQLTDEKLAEASAVLNWRIKQRQWARKYGLAYDLAENTTTLILLPLMVCTYQVIGFGDPVFEYLLSRDNMVSQFVANHDWTVRLGVAYCASTYFTRLAVAPIFRSYCVPKYFNKFGDPLAK